jgi:hypothetical protein
MKWHVAMFLVLAIGTCVVIAKTSSDSKRAQPTLGAASRVSVSPLDKRQLACLKALDERATVLLDGGSFYLGGPHNGHMCEVAHAVDLVRAWLPPTPPTIPPLPRVEDTGTTDEQIRAVLVAQQSQTNMHLAYVEELDSIEHRLGAMEAAAKALASQVGGMSDASTAPDLRVWRSMHIAECNPPGADLAKLRQAFIERYSPYAQLRNWLVIRQGVDLTKGQVVPSSVAVCASEESRRTFAGADPQCSEYMPRSRVFRAGQACPSGIEAMAAPFLLRFKVGTRPGGPVWLGTAYEPQDGVDAPLTDYLLLLRSWDAATAPTQRRLGEARREEIERFRPYYLRIRELLQEEEVRLRIERARLKQQLSELGALQARVIQLETDVQDARRVLTEASETEQQAELELRQLQTTSASLRQRLVQARNAVYLAESELSSISIALICGNAQYDQCKDAAAREKYDLAVHDAHKAIATARDEYFELLDRSDAMQDRRYELEGQRTDARERVGSAQLNAALKADDLADVVEQRARLRHEYDIATDLLARLNNGHVADVNLYNGLARTFGYSQ